MGSRLLWTLLVGLVIVTAHCLGVGKKVKCPQICKCWTGFAVCNGRFNLTEMPLMPSYVWNLKVVNATFGHMSSRTFRLVNSSVLRQLELDNCGIKTMQNDTFQSMTSLETLTISNGNILATELRAGLSSLDSPKLKSLVLEQLGLKNLPNDVFQNQVLQNVTRLSLAGNMFLQFNDTPLRALILLEKASLDNCSIAKWTTSGHPNLRSLSLANNDLVNTPNFCAKDGGPLFLRLQRLGLAYNNLKTINKTGLGCLRNVFTLDLSGNGLTSLADNSFSLMPRLMTLVVDKNEKLLTYQRLAFNSSSLRNLRIRACRAWDQSKVHQDLFRYCPSLETLDLTNTKLKVTEGFLRQLLIPLKRLTTLSLANSNVYLIPRDTLSRLPKLNVLNLAGNGISTWEPSVFQGVSHLKRLILSENNIQMVTEGSFPPEIWRSLRRVNLARNHFNCICELRWFAVWLQDVYSNKSVTVDNYPQDYKCRSPESLHDKLLQSYRPSTWDCMSPYLFLAFVLPPVVVLVVVALVLLYRYRINIQLWAYLLCRKRKGYELIPEGDSFLFEAFVSYSKDDNSWVVSELLPLEKELGLKMCIHQRDFKVGWLIVDNILGSMEASKKILLVLTNSFARSEWCQFELQEALECFLRKRKDVVLVLLEPIRARNLTRPLRLLLERTTYLEWKDCHSARRLLRERLLEPFHPLADEP